MQWDDEKDILLLREIAGNGILLHKQGSRERGQGWSAVADVINTLDIFPCVATPRGVRERFMILLRKYKTKASKAKLVSGLGGDIPTESKGLLEELYNIFTDTEKKNDNESQQKKLVNETEKNKAVEMRTKAMERFGETRKRKDEDNVSEKKKLVNRRSSSDTLIFLKEKLEYDKENKRLEREQVAHAQELSRQ